jgi:hypothetical protein
MFRRVARAEASDPDHMQQLAALGSTGKPAFASQRSLKIAPKIEGPTHPAVQAAACE